VAWLKRCAITSGRPVAIKACACRGIRREVLVQLLLCVLLSDMVANPLPPTCRVTRSSFSRGVLARSGEKVRDGNADHLRNRHAVLRGHGLQLRYEVVAQLHR
jgi:hypothetical protein